ncbi:MAG TPA: CopD family protein, partial [Chloroflexota bacterium]
DVDRVRDERLRLRTFLRLALAVLVLSSGLVLLMEAYSLAGSDWTRVLTRSTLSEVFAGEYGQLWIARQVLVLAALLGTPLIGVARTAPSRVRSLAAAVPEQSPPFGLLVSATLGFIYLALFAASGHAAASDVWSVAGSRLVSGAVFADWLHFIGDGLWFGGQIYIILVLIPALQLRKTLGSHTHVFLDALNRFSPFAYGSIVLFTVSGLFAAKIHIPSWYAFFHSIYGWALVIKVGLIGLMMLVSTFTVFIVRPHIRDTIDGFAPGEAMSTMVWLRRLLDWLGVNPVLGAGVLLATSVMFSYPVPAGLSPAGPSAYPIHIGSLSGTLALQPDRSGPNQVTVTMHDAQGRPGQQATVVVLTTMLDMEMGTGKVALTRSRPGVYVGSTDLGMGGHWSLRLLMYSPAGLAQTTIQVQVGT